MQSNISRRKFLGNASLGVGAIGLPDFLLNSESAKAADIVRCGRPKAK